MVKLPELFKNKLEQDTSNKYKGAVYTTCSKTDQIFSENRLYFFEEYTDHGIRHINSVLETCERLITPETYKLLGEQDISILILSVFLHDLGMHLQPLTFKEMVTDGYDDILSEDFGDQPWRVLWENYLFEAKKFNDQQRKNIFGDINVHITEPHLDKPDTLTGIHRKLIGEFIRRHHPRIAYEVAFKGLTAHDGTQIDFCADFDADDKLLAGLLARSHGMQVRDTFSILETHFGDEGWKRPSGSHVIYLMTVLRLADYFQIDESRVLKIPYLTRKFQSPVSFTEHQKHLQIKYMQPSIKDRETVYVTAKPVSSTYFLALEALFKDIQYEIDQSWAVLGEIYGSERYDEQPKLLYRRIRSNIDNKRKFKTTVPYVPERISFTVDKEVPKLLVGPLYNNNPSFGVRELLQNAVDACWEREFYEKKLGNEYKGEISVKIEMMNGQYVFSITDNGKGMTLEEIKNYFLKVGGSFRKSTKWQMDHVDTNGHSNVNKSGRFGIGVLAAYLLGSEIEVKTRNCNEPEGYRFKTTLDQEQIEITKDKEIKEGTTINILISRHIYLALTKNKIVKGGYPQPMRFRNWYVLRSPAITFKMPDSMFAETGFTKFLPGLNDNVNDWHEIKDENYEKILWSYCKEFSGTMICNGFIVGGYELDYNEEINPPTLMVYDFDAKLPLNLSRTTVHRPLPFSEKLKRDIYRDFIAKLLMSDIRNPFFENQIELTKDAIEHPFFVNIDPRIHVESIVDYLLTLVYFKNGFVLNHPIFLNQLGRFKHLKYIHFDNEVYQKLEGRNIADVDALSILGARTVLTSKRIHFTDVARYFFRKYIVLGISNNVELMTDRTKQIIAGLEKDMKNELEGWKIPKHVSLIYYEQPPVSFDPDLLCEVIADLLGDDLIIPYNIEDRKKKFPRAFKELEPYMRKYLEKK